jgi:hypothetical protein
MLNQFSANSTIEHNTGFILLIPVTVKEKYSSTDLSLIGEGVFNY